MYSIEMSSIKNVSRIGSPLRMLAEAFFYDTADARCAKRLKRQRQFAG